ncbi:NAD(P)H-dependent oxidoreductase [Actinophytocola oryzae]|uniref:NAD(P)H dehydrogenase (Quinone) n=1 Tax=Actinophytocola oryzae TaxID=502181 RepID=A0A4R7W021_9PSEU|nr:NAD(P)H-dependent oxidoreductase [Actinophytocola oryzae]TDV55278.1 NAD(P)H dehydrogenase (quinone) [Actinophytocola oryzae]
MRVLWIYAHPDPRSLDGALRDRGVAVLREHGHEVRESDLYAMNWDPVVRHGNRDHDPRARRHALEGGSPRADICAEHDKVSWADTLVVQFPLWWFGMPAILKGWFDRLSAQGVDNPEARRCGLAGKRAMVVTTLGANAVATGSRGRHGGLDEVLFSLTHGTLFCSGMAVVAPFVVTGSVSLSIEEYADATKRLAERLVSLPATETVPFRGQDGGRHETAGTVHSGDADARR